MKEKTFSKCFKTLSNGNICKFCWKVIPTFGPFISGIKIETNQLILKKEGVNDIEFRHNIGTHLEWKSQKWGSSPQNLLMMPQN